MKLYINILAFILLSFIIGAPASTAQDAQAMMTALRSSDASTRNSAIWMARTLREVDGETKKQLSIIARHSTDPDSFEIERNSVRWISILLIGILKVEEDLPWLIENIQLHAPDYQSAGQSQELLSFEHYFPCAASVTSFDDRAIPILAKAIAVEADAVNKELLIAVARRFVKKDASGTIVKGQSIFPPTVQRNVEQAVVSRFPLTRTKKGLPAFTPEQIRR